MAALNNFKAAYVASEDRILLQATGIGWNQNLWITRRILVLLSGVFESLLQVHYRSAAQQLSGNVAYAEDFAEFAQATSSINNPLQPNSAIEPISTPPIVVYEIRPARLGDGLFAFFFSDVAGNGYGYQLNEALMNALVNLLQEKSNEACWGLLLRKPSAPSVNSAQTSTKRAIH